MYSHTKRVMYPNYTLHKGNNVTKQLILQPQKAKKMLFLEIANNFYS